MQKKENFNGAVEWKKKKNQFYKEALRSFIQDFFLVIFFCWGFYVINVINCIFKCYNVHIERGKFE
jgi:hypothetical protein